MLKRALCLTLLATALCAPCVCDSANQPRSAAAVLAFKRQNPCPSTGQRRGACPGYVVDHIDPLCNAGADHPSNMQWQTVWDAKRKDADERRLCRANKRSLPQ